MLKVMSPQSASVSIWYANTFYRVNNKLFGRSSSNVGPIVGGVFGGLAAVALLIAGYIIYRRRTRRARRLSWNTVEPARPNSLFPFAVPVSSVIGTHLVSGPVTIGGRAPTPPDIHSPTLSEAAPEMAEMGMSHGMGMSTLMGMNTSMGMNTGMGVSVGPVVGAYGLQPPMDSCSRLKKLQSI